MAASIPGNPFESMLSLYNLMNQIDNDLKTQLEEENASKAEEDIQKLINLEKQMGSIADQIPHIKKAMDMDLSSMDKTLHSLLNDVEQGQFPSAEQLNRQVGAYLDDIRHIILQG